ncbi:MAG: hypothetical protein GY950_10975 [bacterium]|nr:hypothetical protein [bacterium]
MKKGFFLSFIVLIGLFSIYASISVPGKDVKVRNNQLTDKGVKKGVKGFIVQPGIHFAKFPLYFITNKGQMNKKAIFYAKASRYTLWLTKKGLIFDSFRTNQWPGGTSDEEDIFHSAKFHRDVSRLIFLNSNKNPGMIPIEETKLKMNYFKGNNKSKWYCAIPTSQAVLYRNLYKYIDLKIYGMEKQIEYDWIVMPGGNPEDIRFRYKNVKSTRLDAEGNLLIKTKFGKLIHKRPVSYQEVCAEKRIEVKVKFKKFGKNTYGFEVGNYNRRFELIIDPVVLAYSTYLGGGGVERSNGIAVDSSGFVYVTGLTYSIDFPTLNQYQTDHQIYDIDAFVTKIDTTQNDISSLVYSTYLGGAGDDICYGIAVDNSGNAYVTGTTQSTDFPTLNQYQANQGTADVFVTKIDTTRGGTSSLIYSTYLGGENADRGHGIAVDNSGNAYVTGETNSTDYPVLTQYQTFQGYIDAFVTKIDTTHSGDSSLIYSTYLGGAWIDYAYGIAVDSRGNAYVTGVTQSTDFPTLNQYQTYPNDYDLNVFVTRIDTTQSGDSSLIYSTYLGGESMDEGYGVAVDNSGNAYVTGTTESANFPTLNQYQTQQSDHDSFATKIDTTQAGASSLIYSTYLGWEGGYFGKGIDLDTSRNVYVTGYKDNDAFVTKIDPTQSGVPSFIFSTLLGGSETDAGSGIAVDSNGNVYVTGWTNSTDFPTLNQYQSYRGNDDAFVTKLIPSTELPPRIEINRPRLDFGAAAGGPQTSPQSIFISNSGEGILNWTATPSETWIQVTPSEGTGSGLVTVSVDITGLPVGDYNGTIAISDEAASNSPQTVSVTLKIYGSSILSIPFGQFSTPVDGSPAYSSIPVTGWVLDDIGVENIKIYRDEEIYIGDAVFVEGARPDVEQAYPTYPFNYKAGWGYMLLTNFLPNGGNGIFKLYAYATDKEGNVVSLGSKTITCDNANAVKPFGAIDTPTQGGTASGSNYPNFGWVLTPTPNEIPTDGSTIDVYVNGVNLGHPIYNLYREDIASLFPGYANSNGAVGLFYLDTTAYNNGVHTIYWTVEDNAGNTDGIGSRYFSVQNSGNRHQVVSNNEGFSKIPVDYSGPVGVIKGYRENVEPQKIYPDGKGLIAIEIKELERIELHLNDKHLTPNTKHLTRKGTSSPYYRGYMMVGSSLKSLPIGSILDEVKGIFYWQPGAGFIGKYGFVFIEKYRKGEFRKKNIMVTIHPKFQPVN